MPHPSLLADTAAVITIVVGAVALIGSAVGCCRWMRNRINEAATKMLASGQETQEHLRRQDEQFAHFRTEVTVRLDTVDQRQDRRERDLKSLGEAFAGQVEVTRGMARMVDGLKDQVVSGLSAHGARLDRLEDDVRRMAAPLPATRQE